MAVAAARPARLRQRCEGPMRTSAPASLRRSCERSGSVLLRAGVRRGRLGRRGWRRGRSGRRRVRRHVLALGLGIGERLLLVGLRLLLARALLGVLHVVVLLLRDFIRGLGLGDNDFVLGVLCVLALVLVLRYG